MRVGTLLALLLLLLAGCERKQSFDERYRETSGIIENQASTMDRELENSAQHTAASAQANASR